MLLRPFTIVGLVAISFLAGCTQSDDVVLAQPEYAVGSVERIALQTCRDWIPNNLQLHGRSLDDYYAEVDVSNDVVVQYFHRSCIDEFMFDGFLIRPLGGFPDYFNVKLSSDGRDVLGHYAQYK